MCPFVCMCFTWVKVLNFQNPELSNLKTCSMPTNYSQFEVSMVNCLKTHYI